MIFGHSILMNNSIQYNYNLEHLSNNVRRDIELSSKNFPSFIVMKGVYTLLCISSAINSKLDYISNRYDDPENKTIGAKVTILGNNIWYNINRTEEDIIYYDELSFDKLIDYDDAPNRSLIISLENLKDDK